MAMADTGRRHVTDVDIHPWERQRLANGLVALGVLMGFGRWCPKHPDYRHLVGPDFVCHGCRYDETRRRQAVRDAVRKPPRPPYERTPNSCSMCAAPPPGRRTSWCSDDCVNLWLVATRPKAALHQLVALHGHRCWSCGHHADELDVDHIRPLWSLDDLERTELRWWLPFNLQLLCPNCHKAKTRAEAAAWALARRGQGVLL